MKYFPIILVLFSSFLYAATGDKPPTVSVSGTWSTPDNVFVCDGNKSSGITAANEDWGTFNFSGITGTINGIEVIVTGNGAGLTTTIGISLSWDGGVTHTSDKSDTFITGGEINVFGGPTDTWGRTWSAGDFSNSNFTVRATNLSGVGAQIDCLTVNVYYGSTSNGIQTRGVYWGGVGTK